MKKILLLCVIIIAASGCLGQIPAHSASEAPPSTSIQTASPNASQELEIEGVYQTYSKPYLGEFILIAPGKITILLPDYSSLQTMKVQYLGPMKKRRNSEDPLYNYYTFKVLDFIDYEYPNKQAYQYIFIRKDDTRDGIWFLGVTIPNNPNAIFEREEISVKGLMVYIDGSFFQKKLSPQEVKLLHKNKSINLK